MSVSLMHHFHTQTSSVKYVSPGVDHFTLRFNDGLVEVETVQVECHRRHTKSGEPDTDNRPRCQEEVKGT